MEWKEPIKRMKMTILVILACAAVVCQSQSRFPFPANDNCAVKASGPTAAFDIEHDRDTVGGGSLFCTLGVTASQANRAILDFKAAVGSPEKLSPNTVIKFPIEVVVYSTTREGKRRDSTLILRTRAEWVESVRKKLNDRQRAAIESAKLSDMMMVSSKGAGPGFILGDGLVFFSTRNPHRIRVWHLNTEVLGD